MENRKTDTDISNYTDLAFEEIKDFTNQRNAEEALFNFIKAGLDQYLPRMLPGRDKVIENAAISSVSQFRAGIKWALLHANVDKEINKD